VEVFGERLAAFDRQGVVERSAEAADVAVAFQAVHLTLLRALEKGFVQIGILQPEGDVHQGTVRLVAHGRIVDVG